MYRTESDLLNNTSLGVPISAHLSRRSLHAFGTLETTTALVDSQQCLCLRYREATHAASGILMKL